MKSDRSSFGDRLLAVEPLTIDSRQKLETELRSMFVRELTTTRRTMFAIVAVVALASAGICGWLAATEPTLPIVARIGLATGTLFGLAWTAIGARLSLRGTLDLRIDNRRIAAMVWTFTTLMMVFFLIVGMSSEDRLLGLMMIGNGLAFLISAAVYWLTHRIEQAELNTRERLLQLELRLAEFCEKS
jgi:MFS family permease